MKTPFRIPRHFALVAGIVCCVVVFSCAQHLQQAGSDGSVTIERTGIFIPGTKISEDDRTKMNEVLSQYRTALYKVQTYEKGKLTKTRGKLSDEVLGEATISQVAENAKLNGLTGTAVQVGVTVGTHDRVEPASTIGTHHHPTPPPHPGQDPQSSIGTRHRRLAAESEALVSRLKPILEKYSKR